MNSAELQRKYPNVYMEFVSNAEDVFVMPHTVTLLGGTACALGGTAFEQKIPLSCYVSIKECDNTGIKIGKYIRFTGEKFENAELDRFETPRNTFLKALEKLYPNAGYEICVLNELGTRTPDIVSFLAVIALEFKENDKFSLIDLKAETKRIYESEFIRQLIKKTESVRCEYNETTKGLSSMASIFCGISEGNGGIIHQAEICLPLPRKDEAIAYSQSDLRRFRGTAAKTVLSGNEELPFELIILHPKSVEKNSHWYGELANTIIGADSISGELDLAMFATSGSTRSRETVENRMKTILSCCEMLTLNAINGLKRYNEGKIVDGEQFWLLSKAHEGSKHILGKSNFENSFKELKGMTEIREAVRAKTQGDYLIFRTGSSIDMNYVVLLSKNITHAERLEVAESIENLLKNTFDTIFSSPKDGTGGMNFGRFCIDDLFLGKPVDLIKIKRIGSNDWEFQGIGIEEFSKTYHGITIDVHAGKIYANGTKVTSKDIPSQQFSSDLLFRILNEGSVNSRKLPHSTYATSKNEMVSKILIPLKRLSRNLTGIEIDWNIEGTESEFHVKIKNPEELNICIVSRL